MAAYGLGILTPHLSKTWLYGQAQSVVVNGVKCSWQAVTKGAPQGCAQPCIFIIWMRGWRAPSFTLQIHGPRPVV